MQSGEICWWIKGKCMHRKTRLWNDEVEATVEKIENYVRRVGMI